MYLRIEGTIPFFWKQTLNLNVLSKACGIAISIESDDPSRIYLGTNLVSHYLHPSHFHSFPRIDSCIRIWSDLLPPQHLLDDAGQHRGLSGPGSEAPAVWGVRVSHGCRDREMNRRAASLSHHR